MITARSRQLIEHPMCQAAECAAVASVAIVDAHSAESLCKAHHDAKGREFLLAIQRKRLAARNEPVEPEPIEGLF